MKRKRPNLREQLAAALLEMKVANANGQLVPVIDRDEAKQMDADKIIARFELDHWPIPVALGGTNHPTNLLWREKGEHREKTAKQDIPAIAKHKRLTAKQAAFRRRLAAKDGHGGDAGADGAVEGPRKYKWPRRPLRSKGFERRQR